MLRAEGVEGYPAELVCRVLGVAKSAYYNRKRQAQTVKEKERLKERKKLREIFEENRCEYGRERLHKAMNESGYPMSLGKVRALMKEEGLIPKKCRKYRATTNSKHTYKVAENILNQEFTAKKPNEKWCGDSTYVRTDEGWLYVGGIIDLCDKSCVGLSFSERHTQDMMIKALDDAYREHRPAEGLLFHSDRGVQYAANDYKARLKRYNMVQSMSRSGNPYDNAAMESFWGTVKLGCVEGERFRTRKAAIKAIFEYVFGFYNTTRYHSSIGLLAPAIYRKSLMTAA
jgi:transposase InsO family protein